MLGLVRPDYRVAVHHCWIALMRRPRFELGLQPICPLFLGAASFEEGAGKAAYYHYTTGALFRFHFLDVHAATLRAHPGGRFHKQRLPCPATCLTFIFRHSLCSPVDFYLLCKAKLLC